VDLRVDPSLPTPPSRQLVEAVLDAVAACHLRLGERLPSVRTLAADALVNPNTVNKAYRELEALGAVEGRNGAGVFVHEGGPAVARSVRRGATLAQLEAALATALGAGHEPAALAEKLESWLEQAARTRAVRSGPRIREGA
jgi:DNA-binding transcriptional regulator YhcF (GntR family)